MARRKVEVKEIESVLKSYKRQLKDAEFDFEDAESRVLYFEDQIRRLTDTKTSMSKTKPRD
jgi:chromosome segregation ATPase